MLRTCEERRRKGRESDADESWSVTLTWKRSPHSISRRRSLEWAACEGKGKKRERKSELERRRPRRTHEARAPDTPSSARDSCPRPRLLDAHRTGAASSGLARQAKPAPPEETRSATRRRVFTLRAAP